MNASSLAQRLKAYEQGKAIPVGARINALRATDDDLLLLAFVRMGGEAVPWAVGFGRPGGPRTFLSVPDPRKRDLLSQMMAMLADPLADVLRRAQDDDALLQVLVPGSTHIDMIHHVALRYTHARRTEPGLVGPLNLLGRACTALFLESHIPGSPVLVAATGMLRTLYAFPAEPMRQQHLGFLCAWLAPRGTRESRARAASEAERLAVGTSLDPEIERRDLQPQVERWNEATRTGKAGESKKAEQAIEAVLRAEVDRRLDTLEACLALLDKDRRAPNAALPDLQEQAVERLAYEARWVLQEADADGKYAVFIPSALTDHDATGAAVRYLKIESAQEQVAILLRHDDEELQRAAIVDGDAIAGTVVKVRVEGSGPRAPISWVVDTDHDGPLRIRAGTRLVVAGAPEREVRVREVAPRQPRGRRFVVSVASKPRAFVSDKGHEAPAAADARKLEGRPVTLLPTSPDLVLRKIQMLLKDDRPGHWVTQLGRAARPAESPEEDA